MWFSSGYDSHSHPSQFAVNFCSAITHDAEETYRSINFLYGATVCSDQVLLFVRFQDHTQTHHIRQHSPGRAINPTQRPLPDNIQQSQETDIHVTGGIRTHNPNK
jgi:hypothetical protein